MEKAILFHLVNDSIKISMEVYFNEKDQLYFDGYDIGKTVNDVWGDSDYEYTYTIEPEEVEKFYALLNLPKSNKSALLQEIENTFSGNHAYTLFGEFMDKNGIQYNSFTY